MKRPIEHGSRMTLFCFPYAGGGASLFREWKSELGPSVDVRAIRLPGRESRIAEPPFTSVRELVLNTVEEISPTIDGPFALFGCSFGALVAFETARALRIRGFTPDHLIVAALKAPHLPMRRKPIHGLSNVEFTEQLARFCGTPAPVLRNPELMELVLPAIRADFQAYESYEHQVSTPLACPVIAMGGTRDACVLPDELDAWRAHTTGPFSIRMFSGDHFFVHSARRMLTWALAQVLSPTFAVTG